MGLLDCVSDKSGGYPVNPPGGQAPLRRGAGGMSSRRSLGSKGLFGSNANVKSRDFEYWWHRALVYLYAPEGREDIRELKIPLRALGFNSIGDFIRDIPEKAYSHYRHLDPDTTLRKDFKVMWEKDGIAEPGMLKWEGLIDGQRCLGLQLDRKKAVPFRTHDGKGLFYCKPGHRALVPASEVYPYRKFLRQFVGIPRKDSMALNLLPGRSSVRVKVAKQYKPGDRVHLPSEGKWATILWTGRISGDWVVDLVYDPEKPPEGKVASPDEPCMSRSLSMGEFIDQVGDPKSKQPPSLKIPIPRESVSPSLKSPEPTTPPEHIPPAPPPLPASPALISIPSPKSPDLVDEVFELTPKSSLKSKDKSVVNGEKEKKAPFHSASDDDGTEEESDSDEELDSGSHNDDPGVATDSDASEKNFKRTFSEPIPGKKGEVKITQPEVEVFETKPLKSRPTHKPLFNLASFGKKKKEKVKPIPAEAPDRTLVPPKPPSPNNPASAPSTPYKKKFHSPKKIASPPQVPTSPAAPISSPARESKSSSTSSSFFRRDRSRSPVSKKDRWSKDQFCEVAIDVPEDLRSPLKKKPSDFVSVELHPQPRVDIKEDVGQNEKSASLPVLELSESPKAVGVQKSRVSPSPQPPLPSVGPPILTTQRSETKPRESSLDESEDESVKGVKSDAPVIVAKDSSKSMEIVELELAEGDEDGESDSSAATPPYSPAIKDVGFQSLRRRTPNQKEDRGSIKKTFGSLFSPKKPKPLPPKDYGEEHVSRKPVDVEIQRQESLRKSEDSCSSDEEMIVEKQPTEPLVAVDVKGKHERRSSWEKKSGGFFSKESKVKERTVESISIQQSSSSFERSKAVETTRRADEDQGDQDGLVLESLEVKDDSPASPSARDDITSPIQRNGSKGKKFSFGFYKKTKSAEQTSSAPSSEPEKEPEKGPKKKERSGSITPSVSSADSKGIVTKQKRNSFRDSFKRTFSFTKDRRSSFDKSDKLSEQSQSSRPVSMYLDNNDVIGAKNISKSAPKSKSTSVLVDIQPWEERRGGSNNRLDVFGDSDSEDEKGNRKSTSSGKGIPVALKPKNPEPSIPKHRMFTTPKTFFGFQTKSTEEVSSKSPQGKKPFPSYSEIRIPSNSWEVTKIQRTTSTTSEKVATPVKPEYPPPPVPKSGPPTPTARVSSPTVPAESPPSVKPRDEASSPSYVTSNQVRILKSSMKQRKEIDEIPKGLKLGDRVVWYNGRIPIPGRVQKLYKDGLDKYTAVVKFDREVGPEPLTLTREGDAYIVTVEELITPEVFGLPLSATRSSSSSDSPVSPEPPMSVLSPAPEPPLSPEQDKVGVRFDAETKKSLEPIVPQVKVEMASPVRVKKDALRRDDSVPPPFQAEETELACGMKRGIPSRDKSCCLETILFSMFYTTNAFDDSVLFYSGFEEECLPFTREVKSLLRHEVVYPLRSLGFCEWMAVLKLKDLMENLGPDFNNINGDAEIMTFVLFERALKLHKFITYSNFETDYLHQLVLDPKDLSKSSTIQRMFEKSLESMDGTKLNAVPNPALILEIPRANDKLERYEAVIPNLTLNLSHLIENGPRLCICKMVGIYECPSCFIKSGNSAMVYCENCKSMADQIHLQFDHTASLTDLPQAAITMDLAAVICVKGGHYTSFVKCGNLRSSPWLYYDAAEADTPKVSLEQNLGMWIDRLEKYPGKYTDAFAHTLLTHFLANSHICIYQPRERSSLV